MTDQSGAPAPQVQDNRRRRSHRFIAVGAFVYLVGQGGAVTAFLLLSDERSAISAVFSGLSPLLIATNAMLVSVVLGWMGISTTERIKLGTPG